MLPTNPIRWLTILVGLGSIYAGIDYIVGAQGDELGQALVILIPFGVSMVVLGLARPPAPGSAAGVTAAEVGEGPGARRGTVFEPAPRARLTTVVGMSGFMCLGIGMVLFPGDSPNTDQGAVRGIGTVIALVFAVLIVLSLISMRRGHMSVALTPEGIAQRGRLNSVRVDWNEIEQVGFHRWRGARSTVLYPRGRSAVTVPLQTMAADPLAFHRLVVHMHANPQDRELLAHPGGAEVLARLGLGAPHPGGGERAG